MSSTSHQLYTCLQKRYRTGRPFVLDLEVLTLLTHLEREQIRDEIDDLVEFGVLRRVDIQYVLVTSCKCPRSEKPKAAPARRFSPAERLVNQFLEAVTPLEPMGIGNNAALGKNISRWLHDGVGQEAVVLMIEEFVEDFRHYCPEGTPPWKAFVALRFEILRVVQDRYEDQHQWDEGFEEKFSLLFPKVLEGTGTNGKSHSTGNKHADLGSPSELG